MNIATEYGTVTLEAEVAASIAGIAATNCFGVKGMTHTSVKDGIVYLLKREAMTKGVKVIERDGKIDLELHIAVDHGVNICAVGKSIIGEVRYHVERQAGVPVGRIDICVDSIRID
ncbi:MAG: Asp23/Gls24 family envelope stress response protein [Clostridiaceae bacterium]|jgi:uncharacterized alkaline shock family protein YloU|nr:Asp23/Gls24 family envelope stress response protein [Clostridiaceae bacterium]